MRALSLLIATFALSVATVNGQTPAPAYQNVEYFGEEAGRATAYSDGLVDFAVDYRNDYDPALPVPAVAPLQALEEFEADVINMAVELDWTLDYEADVEYYEIEHSVDGVIFEYLSQVNAKGFTEFKQDYTYVDVRPYIGDNYYRLVQYDFDGNAAYSLPIRVKVTDLDQAGLKIYPNPVTTGRMYVQFMSDFEGETAFHVFDVAGRLFDYREVGFVEGMNTIGMDMTDLPKGTYFLRFTHEGQLFTEKFIRSTD